jgi:hypothetical protein
MAEYIPFTDEQKIRANEVNLEELLRRRGEKLIPSGRDKRLESNHSITVRGNRWFDHATGEGGGPVSFARTQYGMSYPEAVTLLLGGEIPLPIYTPSQYSEPERKPFALPPENGNMRRVYAYLMKQRCIDRAILTAFAKEKLIYESAEPSKDGGKTYHNAVFIGCDEHGAPRHAHKRSLNSEGKSYRGNVEGSDPSYSFGFSGGGNRLYVFEAPIDLLSFVSLYPDDWREHSYVSLCGTSEHAMLKRLELNAGLHEVVLCLDNDKAGIAATERLTGILKERDYDNIAVLQPEQKDWNEDLVAAKTLVQAPTMTMAQSF